MFRLGDVVYDVNGFVDKNNDSLFQDLKRMLYNTNVPALQAMWPEGAQPVWCDVLSKHCYHLTVISCLDYRGEQDSVHRRDKL